MQDTKKVAGELLVELEKKGVTFETVDGKLKYKDSKGNFTENSKEKVKKYKEEIIEILKKKQTIDEFITDNDYETNVYPLTDVQAAYLVGKTEKSKYDTSEFGIPIRKASRIPKSYCICNIYFWLYRRA